MNCILQKQNQWTVLQADLAKEESHLADLEKGWGHKEWQIGLEVNGVGEYRLRCHEVGAPERAFFAKIKPEGGLDLRMNEWVKRAGSKVHARLEKIAEGIHQLRTQESAREAVPQEAQDAQPHSHRARLEKCSNHKGNERGFLRG